MQQIDGNDRTRASASHMDDPWASFRRQLRIRNILLVIVAIEVLAFDALQWWNVF